MRRALEDAVELEGFDWSWPKANVTPITLAGKSYRMGKQALGWLMKTYPSVTGAWIADRIQMGHLSTASVAIKRFKTDNSRDAERIRKRLEDHLIRKQN